VKTTVTFHCNAQESILKQLYVCKQPPVKGLVQLNAKMDDRFKIDANITSKKSTNKSIECDIGPFLMSISKLIPISNLSDIADINNGILKSGHNLRTFFP